MRLLQTLLPLVLVIFAYGGKVKWGPHGKPKIEKPKKPVKGCKKAKLSDLLKDNNDTRCK